MNSNFNKVGFGDQTISYFPITSYYNIKKDLSIGQDVLISQNSVKSYDSPIAKIFRFSSTSFLTIRNG